MRRRKRRRKRSLRGRILLTLLYILLFIIVFFIIKGIVKLVRNDNEVISNNEDIVDTAIEDNIIENTIENNNSKEKEIKKSYKEVNTYNDEIKLQEHLLQLIGSTSLYNSNEIIEDEFSLIEYAYHYITGHELSAANVTKEDLSLCQEITAEELITGDIGVCKIGENTVYGIYVGNYGSYPVFIYSATNKINNRLGGNIYISYDKNQCNDLFIDMFPVPYQKYYRLPEISYNHKLEVNAEEYLPRKIIAKEDYSMYASAAYRIGEWIRTKDINNMLSRMNIGALKEKGYKLDEEVFTSFINNYDSIVNIEDYIFQMISYVEYDGYTTVHSKVTSLMGHDTDIYFDCTIYDDGSYIPGTIVFIGKYASTYGFKRLQDNDLDEISDDSQPQDTAIINENEKEQSVDTIIIDSDNETYIEGVGYKIDISEIIKKHQ